MREYKFIEHNQQEYAKMNNVGQSYFCVTIINSFSGTWFTNNVPFSESVVLFFYVFIQNVCCNKYTLKLKAV